MQKLSLHRYDPLRCTRLGTPGSSGSKLARGPCGVKELTSYKYVVYGNGQVRQ